MSLVRATMARRGGQTLEGAGKAPEDGHRRQQYPGTDDLWQAEHQRRSVDEFGDCQYHHQVV